MKFTSVDAMRDHLREALFLDRRSIVFHVIDIGDGHLYFGDDLICTHDDLYDSDIFSDLCERWCDEPVLHVYSVESWMIGTGERERPDSADLETLYEAHEASPAIFDAFLRDQADSLVNLGEYELENHLYEAPDDDEDPNEEVAV